MEETKVALDAMGGDNAPSAIVKGAVEAVNEQENIRVYLVGDEEKIKQELSSYSYPADRISIVLASEVIEMAEHPVDAIRKKKDSSMVVGMKMVKSHEADAFVSAGNSGALLVGGQTIIGRIRGVLRAPFCAIFPTAKGFSLLVDSGANVDARAEHLVQFAKMGSIYMQYVLGKDNPTVGLVNNGSEEEKGNALVKETYPLLSACPDIHFIGSVEARDIPVGDVDVVVCDAFVGNVILKLYEGLSATLIDIIKKGLKSTFRSKIGAALALPALKETLSSFDASAYGGAPLLGLSGLVVKAHGNSSDVEIKNALKQCVDFKEQRINEKISEHLNTAGE